MVNIAGENCDSGWINHCMIIAVLLCLSALGLSLPKRIWPATCMMAEDCFIPPGRALGVRGKGKRSFYAGRIV